MFNLFVYLNIHHYYYSLSMSGEGEGGVYEISSTEDDFSHKLDQQQTTVN